MTSLTTEEELQGSSRSLKLLTTSSRSTIGDEDGCAAPAEITMSQSKDVNNVSISSEIGVVKKKTDPRDDGEVDQDASNVSGGSQVGSRDDSPTMTICIMEEQKAKVDQPNPTKNSSKGGGGQPTEKKQTTHYPSKGGGNNSSSKLNGSASKLNSSSGHHQSTMDHDADDPFLNDLQPLPSGGTTTRNYPRSPGAHRIDARPPDVQDNGDEESRPSPRPLEHQQSSAAATTTEEASTVVHEAIVWSDDDDDNMMMDHHDCNMEHDELQISMQLAAARDGDPSMTFCGTAGDDTEQGRRLRMSYTNELVEAKILPDKDSKDCGRGGNGEKKHTICGWLILLFLLLAGLAVLLPILLPSSSSSSNNNNNNSLGGNPDTSFEQDGFLGETGPLRALYPPFQDDLPTAMVNFIKDPEHPHSFANTWVWEDPNRETYSRERQIQRFHLVSFYKATNGDKWFRNDDWLSYDVNECEWFSQHHNNSIPRYDDYSVCDEDNNYLVLNLASNNLQGYFPLVRNFIETLRTYDISNNNIAGSLPSAASPDLEVFVVSNNQFEGLLVGEGNFAAWNLRVIKLDGNSLYGVHEPLFMFLKSLEILDIAGNHFGGRIPKTATMCSNLTEFGIADNDFEGTIPSELSVLTKLQAIDFSGNTEITGTIPSEFGLLPNLIHFDVSGTAVSGDIPTSLCTTIEAEALDLIADCDGPSMLQCCTR